VSELPPAGNGTTIFIVLPVWDHAQSGGSANANIAAVAIARMKRLIFGQNSPRIFETIGITVIVLPVAISGPTAAIADTYRFYIPSALIECLSPGRVIYAIEPAALSTP
jgi:hypothetical protein